jgi:nicotinamidase-related amidase
MQSNPTLLQALDSVLVIVDIQEKLFDVMPDHDKEKMLDNTTSLIDSAHLLNIPIIVTEQYPQGLGKTVSQLSDGLNDSTYRFEKTSFSCAGAANFMATLEKIDRNQIIIVGLETHVCVLQTALDLLSSKKYQIHVIEDATCSRKIEHKFFALQRMQTQGIIVSNYESVLFEWLRNASHPHFKAISHLLN